MEVEELKQKVKEMEDEYANELMYQHHKTIKEKDQEINHLKEKPLE